MEGMTYYYRCGPKTTDEQLWKKSYKQPLESAKDKAARLAAGRGNDKGAEVGKFVALRNPSLGFHIVGKKQEAV